MLTEKKLKKSWFSDNFIELTDLNPEQNAFGRSLHISRKHIVTFYRKATSPTNSVILTIDGKSYDVQESIAELHDMLD